MAYLYSPAPRTPFLSVKKVEPGKWLLVRNGKIHSKNYFYDIPYGELSERNGKQRTEAQITEELRVQLKSAVKR